MISIPFSQPDPAQPDPDYYLRHFWQVIEGVEQRYRALLTPAETDYIATLRALPEAALRLYVRLANRKGPYFRLHKLHYAEIPDMVSAAMHLQRAQLMQKPSFSEDPAECFALFTHAELQAGLPCRFARKAEMRAWLTDWAERDVWLENLLAREVLFGFPPQPIWPFLRFLFFGEAVENLSAFVIKELGYVVPEEVAPVALAPYFQNRAEAEQCYRMHHVYENFRQLREACPALELLAWWKAQGLKRSDLSTKAHMQHDRLVARLGQLLERAGEHGAALGFYDAHAEAPVHERHAKLLVKTRQHEAAKTLCASMLAAPRHAEESYTARQILERLSKQSRRSEARHAMQQSPAIQLAPEGMVEHAVLKYFEQQGWQGVHAENWLWNALFGLFLWDIIHDTTTGAFHQPLQLRPADLYTPNFYLGRQQAIESRLSELTHREDTKRRLMQTHQAKEGLANVFVGWHENLLPMLLEMVTRLPAEGMAAVLRRMAQDVKRHQRGFPDLFLWRGEEYRFLEVKSPNDQLAPHQYHWLNFFREHALEAGIQRVEYVAVA